MIISDLNHLEVVSEASGIVGGAHEVKCKYKKAEVMKPKEMKKPEAKKFILIPIGGTNFSVISQESTAESTAISFGGDATSKAISSNEANVLQF